MSLYFKSCIIALTLILITTSASFAENLTEEPNETVLVEYMTDETTPVGQVSEETAPVEQAVEELTETAPVEELADELTETVSVEQVAEELIEDAPTEQSINLEEENSDIFSGIIEEENQFDMADKPVLKGRASRLKAFIKGERAYNAVMGGMWSVHFSSRKNYREVHNLGALQHKGIFVGSFANSHSRQVFSIAAARTVFKKEVGKHSIFDVGYKIGPMYGYKEGAPDIGGFTILPLICIGMSYRSVGIALNLFPSSAISFNTYIQTDGIINKFKNKFKKDNE